MSSGKRASRFLKDKFTIHRFCFLPLSNVFFLCVCHSLAVFVRDVVSCMGNYISILYHNSVISTKNSKNLGYLLCLSSKSELHFQQAVCQWTAQTVSNQWTKRGLHSMIINWLITQRYQILPFYGRFLPGFNLCKFWAKIFASRKTVKTLIWFWQAICVFTNGMRLETARKLLISHGSVIQWPFCSNNFFVWLL